MSGNLLQISEPNRPSSSDSDSGSSARSSLAIGIDLGTTHSVVAVKRDIGGGKTETVAIADESGRSIIPSVVYYDSDDRALVGDISKIADGAISSVKRMIGRSAKEAMRLLPSQAGYIDDSKELPEIVTSSGKVRNPVEISAAILSHLKRMAEKALGCGEIKDVVITVPAYFDDTSRSATKDAARLAGLNVLRLINEPTAAAMAYGLDNEAEGLYAIYDFGGGTFDISLLNLEKGVFQVLATAGDVSLGGDDVDHLLASYISSQIPTASLEARDNIAKFCGKMIDRELMRIAREAKESLSDKDSVEIVYCDRKIIVTRELLDELIAPIVNRTLDICRQVLADAGKDVSDVKDVVLVGGSTRLGLVRKAVAELFGKEPLGGVDPDRIVAYGAASQAYNLTRGGDSLLLDVVPLSLGLETMGGIVEKIIYRNTPIPTAVAQEFTTYQDGQTTMQIHVLQGEREMVDKCRSLAKFTLRNIPPMVAGAARIRVEFRVDADGLLTVSAKEMHSGVSQQIEVRPTYGLGLEEMEQMLRDSMEHAKEDILQRLLVEAKVDAERTVSEVLSALEADGKELLSDDEYSEIMKHVALVRKLVKESDDRVVIDDANKALQRATASFAQKRMDKSISSALQGSSVDEIQSECE